MNSNAGGGSGSTAQAQASAFRVTLLELQNKTRRDPEGYREEYKSQLEHFNAQCRTIGSSVTGAGSGGGAGTTAAGAGTTGKGAAGGNSGAGANNTNSANKIKSLLDSQFIDVANFVTHCSHCFPDLGRGLADSFIKLLNITKGNITSFARLGIVKNLILLRSKALVSPEKTLPVFFELLLIRDKELRHLIIHHIISDVKKMNINATSSGEKKKNAAARSQVVGNLDTNTKGGASVANKRVQAHLFGVVEQDDPVQSRCALLILMDLYHRNIWADDRTVECIAKGCFSKHTRIIQACLRFFLMQLPKMFSSGGAGGSDSDSDTHDPGRAISKMKQKLKIKKKTGYRERVLDRNMKAQKRKYNRAELEEEKRLRLAIDPMRFVRDPQTFSERLFAKLQRTTERFEIRILYLNVLARVVAEHEIVLNGLFAFLERYMEPTQIRASQMMALSAACVHKLSPPEPVLSLVKVIANHFVNDRSDADSITIGINTIREITKRQPLAMNEELLGDLVEYKQQRGDRGVIMAARALLQFYREVQPSMLPKKLQGNKDGVAEEKEALRYGAASPFKDIPGMELLIMENKEQDLDGMEEDGSDNDELLGAFSSDDSEMDSDDDDSDGSGSDSGEWQDVSSGSEGMIDLDEAPKLVQVDKKQVMQARAGTKYGNKGATTDKSPALSAKKSPALAAKKPAATTATKSPKSASKKDGNWDGMWVDSDDASDGADADEDAPPKKKLRTREPVKKSPALAAKDAKSRQKRNRGDDSEESDDAASDADDEEEEDSAYDGDDEELEEIDSDAMEEVEFDDEDEEEEDEDEEEEGDWEEAGEWAAASDNEQPVEEWEEDTSRVVAATGGKLNKKKSVATSSAAGSTAVPSIGALTGASKFTSSTHVFTDEDFQKLAELKEKALINPRWAKKAKKDKSILAREKKRQALLHDISASNLTPGTIETFTEKKRHADRQEKIEKSIEKRKNAKPFNISKSRKSKQGDTTNTQKNKQGKLFAMTKRSSRVGAKLKRSIQERGERKKDMKKKSTKFRIKRGWGA